MTQRALLTEAILQRGSERESCLVAALARTPEAAGVALQAALAAAGYASAAQTGWQEAAAFITAHPDREAEALGLTASLAPEQPLLFGTRSPAGVLSFREALLACAPHLFAVLDGAQFDNLPQALFDGDFIARPLYLDRGDNNPEQIITAPHLVWLEERAEKPTGRSFEATLDALLALVGDRPAAVFWHCPAGGEALYKHLRGINKVMYPNSWLEDTDLEFDANDTIVGSETAVLLRHADANVMAQVGGAMSPVERTRLHGPASVILFKPHAEWCDGKSFARLELSASALRPRSGFLSLSEATLERIEDRRLAASRYRIGEYLKQAAPEYADQYDSAALKKLIIEAEKTGDEVGFQTEYGHGLWALLVMMTRNEVYTDPQIRHHFETRGLPPEQTAEEILSYIADASDSDLEALL